MWYFLFIIFLFESFRTWVSFSDFAFLLNLGGFAVCAVLGCRRLSWILVFSVEFFIFIFSFFSFCVYGLKDLSAVSAGGMEEDPSSGQLKRAIIDASAGAISGGISRTVTSPLDVIKIRFQASFGDFFFLIFNVKYTISYLILFFKFNDFCCCLDFGPAIFSASLFKHYGLKP